MREMVKSKSVSQLNQQQATSVTLFSILFDVKSPDEARENQRDLLDSLRSGLSIAADLNLIKMFDNYVLGSKLLAGDGGVCERLVFKYSLDDLIYGTFPWTKVFALERYRRPITRYGMLRIMLTAMSAGQGSAPGNVTVVRTLQVSCRN